MPPSANALHNRTKWGGRALSAKAKDFEKGVQAIVASQLHNINQFPVGQGKVIYGLDLTFQFSHLVNKGWTKGTAKTRFRKVDTDNRVKFLQDCVSRALGIPDDNHFFVGRQKKIEGDEDKVFVVVWVEDESKFLR